MAPVSAGEGRRLAAPIGAGAGGADVALDLCAAGSNVLVEGPPGSGKSDLLRSLVVSLAATHPPDAIGFLLLDQEGQGTFGELARLPHAVTVLPRLDAEGAARIAAALRAELDDRERILRDTGSRDMATLEQSHPDGATPSLVVVVDEASRLGAELPDLMDALHEVARHGSRLGLHLVVATRRAAELGAGLRDGASLRLSMRPEPGLPAGRASMDGGPGSPAQVQVAFVSGHRPAGREAGTIRVAALGFGGAPVRSPGASGPARSGGESDVSSLVRAIREAGERAGRQVLRGRFGHEQAAANSGEAEPDAGGEPPAAIPLTDLLGIPDVASVDVPSLWRPRPPEERLRVPIGLDTRAQPMMIDLKEAAAGGAGPHGLLVGTSGSGKSEALRTLVTALALAHPPEILAFVFVDFKGGAAFAGLSRLPHAAGMITNLGDDLSLIDRVQAALTGERNRRQELLRRAGNVDKVSEYQRRREAGDDLPPLPYLLVIVDEFGELLSARPDFVNLFAMIGRVGRSLGMQLLFSSQQFEEGRLRGLEDNLGYRIALRTASPMASRTAIGVPDAFELPKEPGWGYFKAGPAAAVRFRAALVSQPYTSPGAPPAGADAPTTLEVAVERLLETGSPAHQIWLPPLEVGLTLDAVLGELTASAERGLVAARWPGTGRLHVPLGLVDKPAEQRQDVMSVDLTEHLAVVGAAQTGKSALLRTLVCGASLTHTPREAQFYCIDYGGGGLRAVAGLPHVGGVCGRGDPERVRRTVEELAALVAERERRFQELGIDSPQVMRARRASGELSEDLPDVFLVIDGWMGMRQELGELEDAIRDVIAARGPGYGVHLVLTASRWVEVRDALRNMIGGRLELPMTDPMETTIEPRTAARSLDEAATQFARRMKELRERDGESPRFERLYGRGITAEGLHFQTALPRADGRPETLDLHDGTERLVAAVRGAWSGPVAPPIRVLPRSIGLDELPRSSGPEPRGVPVGICEVDLRTLHLDLLGGDPHFLVFGDVESGKSTFLRTFLAGLVAGSTPEQAQVLLIDYRRSLSGLVPPEQLLGHVRTEPAAKEHIADLARALEARIPGDDVPPEQAQTRTRWRSQAEVYVVVDDYDLVAGAAGSPLAPLVPLLPLSRDVGLHLLIARSSGGAGQAVMEPLLRRLRDNLRTPGLLLSGEPQEGALLGGFRPVPLPPGRGRLVRRRGAATFVQVARKRAAANPYVTRRAPDAG
jgi:S-DNA-T family DNA segregation ATPase FtsK/SpoIIIE